MHMLRKEKGTIGLLYDWRGTVLLGNNWTFFPSRVLLPDMFASHF